MYVIIVGIVNNSHQQNNQIGMHTNNVTIGNTQMSPAIVSSPMLYRNEIQVSMTTSPVNNDQNVMEVASGNISIH